MACTPKPLRDCMPYRAQFPQPLPARRAPGRHACREEMTEQDVAGSVKRKLAEKFPADIWQVFVGRNFGCFVTHEDGKYIYFYLGQMGFCIYAA
ncbi:hypothetical protein EON66_12220 [archaeon]|nr:MAG: hypothetical protein EON66_12220 [archaeon]